MIVSVGGFENTFLFSHFLVFVQVSAFVLDCVHLSVSHIVCQFHVVGCCRSDSDKEAA